MNSRRNFLRGIAAGVTAGFLPAASSAKETPLTQPIPFPEIGVLSGKKLRILNVNVPPMPALASGVIHNGKEIGNLGIDSSLGLPDVLSFRRKFGLLLPATNTSMEHELWSILFETKARAPSPEWACTRRESRLHGPSSETKPSWRNINAFSSAD